MARARWVRPEASTAHSWLGMTRGTRSTGNGRCSPDTPKVRPCSSTRRALAMRRRGSNRSSTSKTGR